MFLLNSRLGLFTAAPSGCYTLHGAPLLPKLRGHVAEFLNESSSARLRMLCSPTCVGLRYGHLRLARGFSRQHERMTFGTPSFPPHHSSACAMHGFAYASASLLGRTYPAVRVTVLLRHPIAHSGLRWYRNINLLSFDYAFRPRLRPRLTLSGRTFLRKP